jgi:hypothetical protein
VNLAFGTGHLAEQHYYHLDDSTHAGDHQSVETGGGKTHRSGISKAYWACPIRRCKFSGQAGFPGASISRPFAVQEGEKSGAGQPVTGEGDRHCCFTIYINNRQKLADNNEKSVISKSYLFDFKRIA